MSRKQPSGTDREKIDFCLACDRPVKSCNPYGRLCPYNQRFGMQSDPATMMQHKCGVSERVEQLSVVAISKRGTKVEQEMGVVNPYHTGGRHLKEPNRRRNVQ